MSGMSMEEMANMPGMEHSAAPEVSPQLKAKYARDKRESEFNHHLAGLLVILAAHILPGASRAGEAMAFGAVCMANVFFDCGDFPALVQRHRNLAIRNRVLSTR